MQTQLVIGIFGCIIHKIFENDYYLISILRTMIVLHSISLFYKMLTFETDKVEISATLALYPANQVYNLLRISIKNDKNRSMFNVLSFRAIFIVTCIIFCGAASYEFGYNMPTFVAKRAVEIVREWIREVARES